MKHRALFLVGLLGAALTPAITSVAALPATAQVTAPVASAPPASDPAVQLSVFEVTAEKDLGYAASAAMTGTRTSEKLSHCTPVGHWSE